MKTDLHIFTAFGKGIKFIASTEGLFGLTYSRVSTKEQEKGFSLNVQDKAMEDEASRNNVAILASFGGVYESAKNDEREEFNRMLNFARKSKQKVSIIYVYSVDRFSRSGANAIYIADQLRKENIKIFAVTQPSDTFTPSGKMQQNMQFIFSEYDNDLRREKCISGTKEMLMNGYWANNPPIGYNQKTRSKRKNLDMVVRQEIFINEKGKLIRKAFLWKADDRLTNAEIMVKLNALGLKVSKQQLCKILSNPFYCGLMVHNVLNGEVVQGRHEPIVSKEVFLRANNVKTRNGVWTKRRDFENVPLKNFMKCENCGSSFCGYVVKKKGLWYYKCNKVGCKCNKNAQTMNDLFTVELDKYSIETKYVDPIKLGFKKYFDNAIKTSASDIELLKGRLQESSKKVETLEERFAVGEIDKELFQKFIGKYKKEKIEISKEIEGNQFNNSNLETRLDKYCTILANVAVIWTSNDYRGKIELQELLFPQGILYNRENNTFRTPEINPVAFIMSQLSSDTAGKQKGDASNFILTSPSVPRRRLELPRLATYAPQAYLYTIPTPGHVILSGNNRNKHSS
jgi:site-specific DNA recombinase